MHGFAHDAKRLQFLEAVGERRRVASSDRPAQVVEPPRPLQQGAHDVEHPFLLKEIDRPRRRAEDLTAAFHLCEE